MYLSIIKAVNSGASHFQLAFPLLDVTVRVTVSSEKQGNIIEKYLNIVFKLTRTIIMATSGWPLQVQMRLEHLWVPDA